MELSCFCSHFRFPRLTSPPPPSACRCRSTVRLLVEPFLCDVLQERRRLTDGSALRYPVELVLVAALALDPAWSNFGPSSETPQGAQASTESGWAIGGSTAIGGRHPWTNAVLSTTIGQHSRSQNADLVQRVLRYLDSPRVRTAEARTALLGAQFSQPPETVWDLLLRGLCELSTRETAEVQTNRLQMPALVRWLVREARSREGMHTID
jgi:hypothetical protein